LAEDRRSGRSYFLGLQSQVRLDPRDVLRELDPRLCQGEPERLVAVIVSQPRHRNAFFRTPAVIQNGPHGKLPDTHIDTSELQSVTAAHEGSSMGGTLAKTASKAAVGTIFTVF
jgi:hypothetical protein